MPSWRDFAQFIRFAIYSFLTFGSLVAGWVALDLPQVASKDYVNTKFQLASDSSRLVQSQLTSTRLMLNKMTRQGLEAEKYRLIIEQKANNSFDIQKRLQNIEDEIDDAKREREILLKP